MKWKTILSILAATVWLHAPPAQAESVALAAGSSTPFSATVSGTTINVYLPGVAALGPIFLEFSGLASNTAYTVNAYLTNTAAGTTFDAVEAEVLNPTSAQKDALDMTPQASYIPPGYSASNDHDGYSFAQYASVPRTSDVFTDVFVDETTNMRDFLRYSGGLVTTGASTLLTFGVQQYRNNRPFLVALVPQGFAATPEPGTLLLIGTGVLGVARTVRQRRRKNALA
jgi:hypothetical protein